MLLKKRAKELRALHPEMTELYAPLEHSDMSVKGILQRVRSSRVCSPDRADAVQALPHAIPGADPDSRHIVRGRVKCDATDPRLATSGALETAAWS